MPVRYEVVGFEQTHREMAGILRTWSVLPVQLLEMHPPIGWNPGGIAAIPRI